MVIGLESESVGIDTCLLLLAITSNVHTKVRLPDFIVLPPGKNERVPENFSHADIHIRVRYPKTDTVSSKY